MGIRKACDECGKTFISNIVLNKHKKHVHRKEGAYPCKACGKVYCNTEIKLIILSIDFR